MAKCTNHLPKIVTYNVNGRYQIHALWNREGRPTSLDQCINFVHGDSSSKLSDCEKAKLYFQGYSRAEAEFYADEVEGYYILKIQEDNNCGPRDFGIAQSPKEAQERLKKATHGYIEEWITGVKQELNEVQTQTGHWDPSINHLSYRTQEYISRLEQEVKNFELIHLD